MLGNFGVVCYPGTKQPKQKGKCAISITVKLTIKEVNDRAYVDFNTYMEKPQKASLEEHCSTWILKTESEFLGRWGGMNSLKEDLEVCKNGTSWGAPKTWYG